MRIIDYYRMSLIHFMASFLVCFSKLEHLNLRNDKPNTCLIADSFLADDNIVSFAPSFVGKSAGKMEWICSIE